ncbi:MAG: hypothetical protein LBI60_01675 [Bacteroidales bacterium]|jgi:hypothetical protein|nr:hypothetical protein [Bacteroidales bacterium]
MCKLEVATLISAVLVFISACITAIITVRYYRKSLFINAVTEARKEYIKELRDLIAKFCVAATFDVNKNEKEKNLRELSYKIKLRMNPAGFPDWWDGEAVKLIDGIIQKKEDDNIENLIVLMQSWFALEWDGLSQEGEHGILKLVQKDTLRKKYWEIYKNKKV